MVAQSDPGVVAHEYRQVVLDGDAGAEDVEVAPVAVLVLGLQVQLGQLGTVGHVQREGVGLGLRGTVAARVAGGGAVPAPVLVPVEEQAPGGVDLLGPGVDPPVDQVEVVARLVHEESAGAVFVPVPAPEVVSAVVAVEQPFEVHRADLADRSGGDELADLAVDGVVAVVEADRDAAAGAVLGVVDPLEPVEVGSEGFLGDGVRAGLECSDDVVGVEPVDGADDGLVDGLLAEHAGEGLGGIGGDGGEARVGDDPVVHVHTGAVGVAQGHEPALVAVFVHQCVGVHPGP